MATTTRRPVRLPCPGSGRRTQPTGSSAFPEVRCPECFHEARPVYRYGEYVIRAHQPRKTDPDA